MSGRQVAPLLGLVAEFDDDAPLLRTLRDARAAGWRGLDAFGPHPLPEAAPLLGVRATPVGIVAASVGVAAAAAQYGVQYWLGVQDYPLNVGGRPPHAWPVFLPAAYIVGVLWAAAAALVGMLLLNRLPRLHHPIFNARGFGRASEDRWFLFLPAADAGFDPVAAELLLRAHGPLRVTELRG
ncbi:DUF3341 domain-containing protein [Roseomonas sp. NAR14]|uniref:DUF3341 domain-containing protein n=1 Tax=Roseomonas acroporae TaxID=2937791 RepID=A0A9X1YJZ2_9PROT|nr:DUF3341 domain-containing protein [Roseomonas acroporae]MCK8787501.1 DUF3341 domain-containing protein [Roseomonas acroporae]